MSSWRSASLGLAWVPYSRCWGRVSCSCTAARACSTSRPARIGVFGAYVYYRLHLDAGWAWPLAMAVALVSCAAIGCLMHLVVLRRLWRASVSAKIVATLGLMTILMAIANLAFAPNGLTQSVTVLAAEQHGAPDRGPARSGSTRSCWPSSASSSLAGSSPCSG